MPTHDSSSAGDDLPVFRNTVRRFIEAKLVPRQSRWREQQRADPEAWLEAGAIGMLLPDVPQAYGGGGGSFGHEAVVIEELARAGVHFGSSVQSIVSRYILGDGSEEQK